MKAFKTITVEMDGSECVKLSNAISNINSSKNSIEDYLRLEVVPVEDIRARLKRIDEQLLELELLRKLLQEYR